MVQTQTCQAQFDIEGKLAHFFVQVSRAHGRTLLLDYDGTLAQFRSDPSQATPYREVPPLLDRIRKNTDTRVVIVSGRRAQDAARLLGLENIEVWGCHGLERLHADGASEIVQLDGQTLLAISQANELLTRLGLAELLEHKPVGTAIHWRGREAMSADVAEKVRSVWSMLANKEGLRLEPFDGGMEIRVTNRNKGDVVNTILAEMGENTTVAYLGDDRTDEDAFAALEGRGLRVLVRDRFRETAADVWIRPPEGLLGFLGAWSAACGGGS